jgi:formylglycine-generating enzyme required for sulfatase activity
VTVDSFWMDRAPVTNREFRKFVEATGYVTFAEIAPDPKDRRFERHPHVTQWRLDWLAGAAGFETTHVAFLRAHTARRCRGGRTPSTSSATPTEHSAHCPVGLAPGSLKERGGAWNKPSDRDCETIV